MDQKSVLITGCSSGFGRLTAEELSRNGLHVFASMRNVNSSNAEAASHFKNLAEQEKLRIAVLDLDVSSDESVANAVSVIRDEVEHLDVLVNNAGFSNIGVTEAFSLTQIKRLFEVNTFGPMRICKEVLPMMRAAGSGCIVNVSSGFGRLAMPYMAAYCASKFALEAYSEAMYYELKPLNIDMVIVEPGAYPTEVGAKLMLPDEMDIAAKYPDQEQVISAIGSKFAAMFAGAERPDPSDLASAIMTIISQTAGRRPVRVVVDPLTGHIIRALNEVTIDYQRAGLSAFGMESLAKNLPIQLK